MNTDYCSCTGGKNKGQKAQNRMAHVTWCPICDRGDVRRRCQSEGCCQEVDPLKELNRCCGKACDFLSRSTRLNQPKRPVVDAVDKRITQLFSSDVPMEGDGYHTQRHRAKTAKEKPIVNGTNHYRSHLRGYHEDLDCVNSGLPYVNENPRQGEHSMFKSGPSRYDPKTQSAYLQKANGDYAHSMDSRHDLSNSKPGSFSEREKTSSELREKYIKEMAILKSKLSILRGGMGYDGKRLRQRSESEPGFGGASNKVVKKAKDDTLSSTKTSRKLPLNPAQANAFNSFPKASIFHQDTKSLPPSTSAKELRKAEASRKFDDDNDDDDDEDDVGDSPDSELDDSFEGKGTEGGDISEDDDGSVLSSLTSASNDSNTPSRVGKTLGSITLCEKKDLPMLKAHAVPLPSPLIKPKSPLTNPFRNSLFSNVPPYVNFSMHDIKGPTLPTDITRHLKWKLSTITPIVIRRTLVNSGFKLVRRSFAIYYENCYIPPHRDDGPSTYFAPSARKGKNPKKESNDWTGQWGKHMKSFVFKTLKDFQKLNHFPGTFQIGRKDRLWKNLYRLRLKFGKREFGFIPRTYILPQDSKLLRAAWEKSAPGGGQGQWIVKPPAAARGTGIKVVHRWGQIPRKRPLIVQKYIGRPFLINGSKFDLRLYVLMTSIHPLRIYLYDDGLVRFASVKYSDDMESLSDRFMHLTNYSINKLSTQYCANEDASACLGHKWTLKALWSYFEEAGVNVRNLRRNLTDLVIKTIISGEGNITVLTKNNLPSRYCSYELFGIDVLLDDRLTPWLLEVNISPSLHSASPLDLAVKGPLVKELLNVAGFQIPGKMTREQEEALLASYGLKDRTHSLCYDKRLYTNTLSKAERIKQENHHPMTRKEYLSSILEELTPDDVRHLIQFEDELTQIGRFEKVFPTSRTHVYHQFFDSPRYYNMMMDAWETKYHLNRAEGVKLLESYCQQKMHLSVPFPGGKTTGSASQSDLSILAAQEETSSEPEAVETSSETARPKAMKTRLRSGFPTGYRARTTPPASPKAYANCKLGDDVAKSSISSSKTQLNTLIKLNASS